MWSSIISFILGALMSVVPETTLIMGDSEACAVGRVVPHVKSHDEIVDVACKGGTRTKQWSGKWTDDALAKRPYDTVIVFLGTNDYGTRPDPKPIVDRIVASGAKCVWVGPPNVFGKAKGTSEHLKSHVAPCRYLDTQALSIPLADGVHPTNAGAVAWLRAAWALKSSP